MNLRTTPLLFGLLLGILWLFGLMLVYKKAVPDESLILPSMSGAKIDLVTIEYNDGKEGKDKLVFTQDNGMWYLQQHDQKVRVEGFKIDQMIREVQTARRYEEARPSDELSSFGLEPPRKIVTFKGTVRDRDKEWQLRIGNDDTAKFLVYVNSTDPKKSGKAFPVVRSTLESLFFKNVAALRSQRLFDIIEPSVTSLFVKDGEKKLLLKKTDNVWRFEMPPLGFAEIESPAAVDDKKPGGAKTGGVKALILAIGAIHVDGEDDFEPLGTDLASKGVADGKETMRIELGTGADKADKADKDKKDEKAKKDGNKEVLLIGKPYKHAGVKKNEVQYYARLLSDDGVFRINEKMLEQIKQAVEDPKRIRSNDVAVFETKNADAIIVNTTRQEKDGKGQDKSVKEEIKLLRPDDKEWKVIVTGDKLRKGDEKAIQALLDTLQGKNAIKEFADGKDDTWGGLNSANATEISIYLNAIDKDKKADKKTDKKDDKKSDKKDDKKGDKKDEKKEDEIPSLKKDAKAVVKLIVGTVDKEKKIAHVKRVLQDGSESRFTVDASFVDKLHLDDPALAFLDSSLPQPQLMALVALDIERGKEKIELNRDRERADVKFSNRWLFADGKLTDQTKVFILIKTLDEVQARKWVKNDGSDKYGFKEPQFVVTVYTKQEDRVAALAAASLMGTAFPGTASLLVPAFGPMLATRIGDAGDKKILGEKTTITFGKEIEQDKEKLVYVRHSGTDLIALVPAAPVKAIREADLRDRSAVLQTQGQVDALFVGLAAAPMTDPTLLPWPLVSGTIYNFDPAKVAAISINLRTRVERRTFKFEYTGKDKDKTWVDKSGVEEFQPDPEKVTQMLDQLAKLKTERFASFAGPNADNKLSDKDATVKIDVTFEDKSTVTLTVGAAFFPAGYFATSSAWPDAVFFLPPATVEPWLQGAGYFGKERATAAP